MYNYNKINSWVKILVNDKGHPVNELITAWEKISAMIVEVEATIKALDLKNPEHHSEVNKVAIFIMVLTKVF